MAVEAEEVSGGGESEAPVKRPKLNVAERRKEEGAAVVVVEVEGEAEDIEPNRSLALAGGMLRPGLGIAESAPK